MFAYAEGESERRADELAAQAEYAEGQERVDESEDEGSGVEVDDAEELLAELQLQALRDLEESSAAAEAAQARAAEAVARAYSLERSYDEASQGAADAAEEWQASEAKWQATEYQAKEAQAAAEEAGQAAKIASQYLDTVSSAALERFAEARAVAAALVRSRDAYKTAREAAAGKVEAAEKEIAALTTAQKMADNAESEGLVTGQVIADLKRTEATAAVKEASAAAKTALKALSEAESDANTVFLQKVAAAEALAADDDETTSADARLEAATAAERSQLRAREAAAKATEAMREAEDARARAQETWADAQAAQVRAKALAADFVQASGLATRRTEAAQKATGEQTAAKKRADRLSRKRVVV